MGASPTNIATTGSYMDAPGGLADAFLVKFDSTGQRLWGTYYGGAGFEQSGSGAALAFDAVDDIYFCGRTGTATGIVSGNVWQPTLGGLVDGYVAKFTPAGNQVWATYYGGLLHDQVNDCVFDGISSLYVIGNTMSDNNIATTGAFQTSNQGGYNNAFLSRIYDCFTPSMPLAISVDTVCVNDTVVISVPPINGAISYTWTLPSGWQGSSDSSSITVVTGSGGGLVTVTANSACGSSTALSVNIPVHPAPIPTIIVIGNQLNTGTFTAYQWCLNGNAITGATGQFYTFTQQGVYTVMVTDNNGCKATSPAFTTAVNELKEENAIQLYPNPNSGEFTINVPAKGTVQIYDMTGRLLQTQEIKKGSTRITLPDALPAGLYLLRFIGSEHNTIHHHTFSYQPE